MQIIKGDLWGFTQEADAICIPVNGFVKRNGDAVIGRTGLAHYTITYHNSQFGTLVGNVFKFAGYSVQKIAQLKRYPTWLITFPTKPDRMNSDGTNVIESKSSDFPKGKSVPGWACKADLYTIAKSCLELKDLTNKEGFGNIYLPKIGTGTGERKWEEIEPILKVSLDDDRFKVIDYDIPY